MKAVRRLFVLLGVYENLADRETRALRRGDLEFAIGLGERKRRLNEALGVARKNALLSEAEITDLRNRVRILEQCERENIAILDQEMARTRTSLASLNRAATRTREVKRGYVDTGVAGPALGTA